MGAEAPPEAPPATYAVTFIDPADGGVAVIFACPAHVAATITRAHEFGVIPAVHKADPAGHGCKGHLEEWETS